ncbi:Protein of unknown function [Bradyrhizobium brasilense]|uniref:DUF3800 domain-containing protein n=2 Tax=Bradyrhizobium brasilense TaxID=1419277 RepID=A0A1G6I8X8_9BRAD|nr:Protein of unknown function [Bradyrhizobium brasilense]
MISSEDPLQAFVDASGNGDPNVLVIAGYVARASDWAKFSEAWKQKLLEADLRRLKMNEMTERRQRQHIAAYFYRTIEEFKIEAAISCVFDTAGLRRFVSTYIPDSPSLDMQAVRNPYLYAARQIIKNLALGQERMGLLDPVDFIFDNEAEKARLSPHWDWFRSSLRPEVRRLMGRDPIYQDDETCMPLQAADLWAWWVRKWHEEGNEDGVRQLALPWGPKRYIKRTHWVYDEAFFRTTLYESLLPDHPEIARKIVTLPGEGIPMTLPDLSSLNWRR